jgi:hypothetical protein
MDRLQYQSLAEIEVDAVRPDQRGFTLTGQGRDRAQYEVGLQFDMPLDSKTRAVLGELLSQAELTVWRRVPVGSGHTRLRERAHKR